MNEPLTMTNDEAQDWLLAQHNAAPGPPDAARFGAAIRAIRAKAIKDAKELLDIEPALRQALASLDLTLYSKSGAHVFNSDTAITDLAASIEARLR